MDSADRIAREFRASHVRAMIECPDVDSADWYESEQPTRTGMIAEAQRVVRRLRMRPVPVIVLTCAITALASYRVATRRTMAEAEVVLALTEGSLSQGQSGMPLTQLHEFVESVLLPNAKLLQIVEKHNLHRLRHRFGDQYAINELRDQFTITIWRNTFSESSYGGNSARIGLTVVDEDPELALQIARDLAAAVTQSAQEQRQLITKGITTQIAEIRDRMQSRYEQLVRDTAVKEQEQLEARRNHDEFRAQALELELAVNWREQRKAAATLADIAASRDTLVERISEAGLDMSVSVVEEHPPRPPENRGFVVAVAAAVTAVGALIGSTLLIGAFDSRVHNAEDVERLNIAFLGHLPGFPGDQVGSLRSRSEARARVPSFRRWRSQR